MNPEPCQQKSVLPGLATCQGAVRKVHNTRLPLTTNEGRTGNVVSDRPEVVVRTAVYRKAPGGIRLEGLSQGQAISTPAGSFADKPGVEGLCSCC
eukprot:1154637-Pelagomonas_calceolata.AAC.3